MLQMHTPGAAEQTICTTTPRRQVMRELRNVCAQDQPLSFLTHSCNMWLRQGICRCTLAAAHYYQELVVGEG